MNTTFPELTARLLEDRGFTWVGGGFERDDLTAKLTSGWIRLVAPRQCYASQRIALATTQPGLWKQHGRNYRIADLPWGAFGEENQEGLPSTLGAVLDWVLASSAGTQNPEWLPPASDLLAQWLPSAARNLRFNTLLTSIDLSCSPTLTLSCTLTNAPLGGQRTAYRDAIHAVILDWQSACRMVRVRQTEQEHLMAEIDLTGAPLDVIEPLLLASIECMRSALQLLLPVLDVLSTHGLRISILDPSFPAPSGDGGVSSNTNTASGEEIT